MKINVLLVGDGDGAQLPANSSQATAELKLQELGIQWDHCLEYHIGGRPNEVRGQDCSQVAFVYFFSGRGHEVAHWCVALDTLSVKEKEWHNDLLVLVDLMPGRRRLPECRCKSLLWGHEPGCPFTKK